MAVSLMVGALAVVWLGQAFGLSRIMARRGFHPLAWFVVSMIIGPAVWPLALVEWISGPPRPHLVARGNRGLGSMDVFVGLELNEFPDDLRSQLRNVMPSCGRLVLGRVIRAGGPTHISQDAEIFLRDSASRLGAEGAELQVLYGEFDKVVGVIQERGEFDLVLRSDLPSELFDTGGLSLEVSCLRDVAAA